jgi:hypothetical protein
MTAHPNCVAWRKITCFLTSSVFSHRQWPYLRSKLERFAFRLTVSGICQVIRALVSRVSAMALSTASTLRFIAFRIARLIFAKAS